MKKIISLLLAATMLLPLLCINASAASKYSVKISRDYNSGYTYVKLTSSADAIYYTTDGTKPDTSDKKYTKKIKVTKPCTLRIAAYKNGKVVCRTKASVKVRLKAPVLTKVTSGRASMVCYKVSADGKIYYTTDGTTPDKYCDSVSTGGKIYAYPGDTVKAIATKSGWRTSNIRKITAPEEEADSFTAEVVRLVNKARAAEGLSALKTDSTLTKAAEKRADEQLKKYGHTRPDGSSCFTIMAEYDLKYMMVGENAAAGQTTPEEVVNDWLNSPGHRANILKPDYEYIGVGYANNSTYDHYWIQLFWTPRP